MSINFRKNTIIDALPDSPYAWSLGSGTDGIWSAEGTTAENERVYATDPWGDSSIVWEARPSGAAGLDGGFNPTTHEESTIRTKLYRFSVWVRRTSSPISGLIYFGPNDFGGNLIKLVNGR